MWIHFAPRGGGKTHQLAKWYHSQPRGSAVILVPNYGEMRSLSKTYHIPEIDIKVLSQRNPMGRMATVGIDNLDFIVKHLLYDYIGPNLIGPATWSIVPGEKPYW